MEKSQNSKTKKCIINNNNIHLILNLFTHITLLFIILTFLFVFYTKKLIEDSTNNQVFKLIEDNFNKVIESRTSEEIKMVKDLMNKIKLENYNNNFSERDNNNELVLSTLYIIVGILLLGLIFLIILSKKMCTNISYLSILGENIIIFLFVGIVEVLFITNIIVHYIPAYPSTILQLFVKNVKQI